MDGAVERCRELIEETGRTTSQVSVNAAKLVAIREDPELRDLVLRSDLVTADGQSVVWASRLLGDALPERVAGIDLMQRLLHVAEHRGHRVFFLGATPHVLAQAVEAITFRHPRLHVAGSRDGYFGPEEEPQVRGEIRAAAPDILFVAMPSPRKEQWVAAEKIWRIAICRGRECWSSLETGGRVPEGSSSILSLGRAKLLFSWK